MFFKSGLHELRRTQTVTFGYRSRQVIPFGHVLHTPIYPIYFCVKSPVAGLWIPRYIYSHIYVIADGFTTCATWPSSSLFSHFSLIFFTLDYSGRAFSLLTQGLVQTSANLAIVSILNHSPFSIEGHWGHQDGWHSCQKSPCWLFTPILLFDLHWSLWSYFNSLTYFFAFLVLANLTNHSLRSQYHRGAKWASSGAVCSSLVWS